MIRKKIITPSRCKTPKSSGLPRKFQHRTEDKYRYILKDWSNVSKYGESPIRSEFSICSNSWSLDIYPSGINENAEYLSVRLVNMSEVDVFASYVISVINQDSTKSIHWKDPECPLIFQSCNTGDNSWGPDELISIKTANRKKSGFCVNDSLIFDVSITVYGAELDSIAERAVLKGRDEILATSLSSLMDEDLEEIHIKPFGRLRIEQERSLQDHLITTRLQSSPPAMTVTKTNLAPTNRMTKNLISKYGFVSPKRGRKMSAKLGSTLLSNAF
mmetsp:Transcript_4342/g.4459  ORF Transcript_4342/g.4459 Transcript_4342/m.4459 type:complete len:273 (+) Transcript_4342:235-1053(+)